MARRLPPNSTIGIFGGGQLGRMLSVAASRLGYKTCIFEPGGDCPASHVANYHFQKSYDDADALRYDAGLRLAASGSRGVTSLSSETHLASQPTLSRLCGYAVQNLLMPQVNPVKRPDCCDAAFLEATHNTARSSYQSHTCCHREETRVASGPD